MSSLIHVVHGLFRRYSKVWIWGACILFFLSAHGLADGYELTVVATIDVGHEPVGVAVSPDGGWVYVTTLCLGRGGVIRSESQVECE